MYAIDPPPDAVNCADPATGFVSTSSMTGMGGASHAEGVRIERHGQDLAAPREHQVTAGKIVRIRCPLNQHEPLPGVQPQRTDHCAIEIAAASSDRE